MLLNFDLFQSCKIPNKLAHSFSSSSVGGNAIVLPLTQVTHVKFSGDGRSLGVADGNRDRMNLV